MSLHLDVINLVLISVIFAYCFLVFLIFSKGNNKNVVNSFSAVIISVIFWTIGMIFYRLSGPLDSLFWCRILYVAATFTASTFFIFSYIFPYGKLPNFKIMFATFLVNLFLIILVLMPKIIIKDVDIIIGQEKQIIWGNWYFIYFLYISSFFSTGLFILFKKYLKEQGLVKQQIKNIFWGYFIGSNLAMFTNLLMVWWGDFRLNWAGQVLSVFMAGFTVYTIIAHRLMDIKLVMRRYSVYLSSLISILLVAIGIKYFFDRYFPQFTDWVNLFMLMGSVSVYPVIKDRFYHLSNKYFFSSLYDSGEVIASLSEKLRSTLEAEKIYGYIFDTLSSAFHAKAIGILTYNEKTKKYIINYNNGFNTGRQKEFDEDKKLNEIFVKRNRTIITDDIKTQFKNNKTLDILLKLGVELLTPLNVKDKTIGLIVLGAKESGDMYNEEDLKVLEVVGAQTAIALENALLYKETKNFSVKMEKEVEKATRDLIKANVQLKKLDAAKSEFISIASHQLRTPLTVIKGYISMMLEGNFGALTKSEVESLEKVFLSNERLIQLVENLLNISRIESGRLQFDFQEVDLNKMVADMTEELSGNAKKKNLILQYKPPAKPLPLLKIDDEKIRQVVMNLIDNGIKYTKQGSVTVTLEQIGNKIKFCVADSGMGITPEDMANLFKKFSRGTGTSLIHTEGTGLGLFVARMMVEAHKGKIWAESQGEGKGSKFCFELPVK